MSASGLRHDPHRRCRHRIGWSAPVRRPFRAPGGRRRTRLLIFSEMWGVAPKKREMADDYARRGWCAIAPNMFWRSEFTGVVPFDQADKAWQRLQAFDFDKSADDCRTAVAMAARVAALQRQDRGDRLLHGRPHRVPRGVTRRRRRRHRALRARHRQAPRRGSQDGRSAPAPLRPRRRAHSEIRDRHGRRRRRRQRAISRSNSTPAPDTASSTGRFRPTMRRRSKPRPPTSTGSWVRFK